MTQVPELVLDVALFSFGVVGMAFGRCWKWVAEKDLRDELRQAIIRAERAEVRAGRAERMAAYAEQRREAQNAEIRVLRRSMAMCACHPSTPTVTMAVRGGDDPTLAGLRRDR